MSRLVEVEVDGTTYEIEVPEGQDVGAAVADFESSLGVSAPTGGAEPRTFGESAARSAGLLGRSVVGAIPRAAAGLADLGGMAINAVSGGIDAADRFIAEDIFGREPLPDIDRSMAPTDNVAGVNAMLDRVFPAPETFAERAAEVGIDALLTGGGGAAALAARAPQLRNVPTLADEIGTAFLQNPKTVAASELLGGAGAQAGGELAADAEVGELGRLGAAVAGGFAGAVSPTALQAPARATLGAVSRTLEPITPGGAETRAARSLQETALEPETAAQRALDAPEGVGGGRASEDQRLRRIEKKIGEDDADFADDLEVGRARAETETIEELSVNAPERDQTEWQRRVVTRAAPEGTQITGSQPDEMMEEAFQSFRREYAEIDGYPIKTKVMQVEGGDIGMPELVGQAIVDPRVLANENLRETVGNWVWATFKDVARRGTPLTTAADEVNVQFMSEDLLEFRQVVRTQQRRLQSAGRTNADSAAQAELLANVDRALTDVLESQAPESASDALRALDGRYADFKTVEDAVLRGTPGDLTPQQLQQSIKMRSGSRGRVARGNTGELGQLAEQGTDVRQFIGKSGKQDQQLRRTMRTMDEDQAWQARDTLIDEINSKSRRQSPESGELTLNGESLLRRIEENRSTLKAAGFADADLNRMEQLAKRLRMIQSPDPKFAAGQIVDDNLGMIADGIVRVAALRSAKRLREAANLGSAAALTLPAFFTKWFSRLSQKVKVESAERIIKDAMQPTQEGRELFAALMTRSTAPEIKRARSARTLNAWAAQVGSTDNGEE